MQNFFRMFLLAVFSVATFSLALDCAAQGPKVLAPHKPVAPRLPRHREWDKPAVSQMVTGGLWMTDGNFKSQLHLKNLVETDGFTVTPILYLGNGVSYPLSPVQLEPSGTAIVDINQALAAQGIAPYATLSGYVEVRYSWPWAAICATVRNVDLAHSLIFMYGLQSGPDQQANPQGQAAQNFEGMWWRQEPNVYGFVALSNVTAKPIHASLQVTGAGSRNLAAHDLTVSPHGTKVVELTELLSATDLDGGVSLSHDGPEHGLAINAGLEDPATGYSAHLPIGSAPDASAKVSETSLVQLGLMTGAADPMMSFPNGTAFTPYAVARNISGQPFAATPTLWWMEGGVARSAQLPRFTVAAHQTQNMNVPALLAAAGLKNWNGSFNLELDTQGETGGLLISSGSVDQKNTYVFEVAARGISESISKSLSYWSTGNGDDTMVTVWNPADEAQDFVFTLYFTGGGHYGYPIHLEPRATHTFNISEIIHTATPDAAGNVIPSGVHEGSARISGSRDDTEHILVAMDSGDYNIQKATCGGGYCETCDGFTNTSVADNPFAVAVGGTKQQTFVVQYDTGNQYNRTSSSSWSSSNTSMATVSSGLVYGVAVGSLTVSALDGNFEPVYTPNVCGTNLPPCPIAAPQQPGGSAPGNTTPTINVSCTLTDLALGPTAPASTTTGDCATSASPTGGTFSWSSNKNTITVNPSQNGATAQYTSASQSSAAEDTYITVKYTCCGSNATSASANSASMTVHKPSSLVVISDTGSTQNYSCTAYSYCGVQRLIQYQAQDTLGPIPIAGLPAVETFNPGTNSCFGVSNTPTPGNGQTLSNGYFNSVDTFAMCSSSCLPRVSSTNCSPTGSCTVAFTQFLSVAGVPVRTNAISVACKQITVTPQ